MSLHSLNRLMNYSVAPMSAEIHPSYVDNLKSFPDIHRGESDIPGNEYAKHSIFLNLTKPIKIYCQSIVGSLIFIWFIMPVKNKVCLLGQCQNFTAPESNLLQTHRQQKNWTQPAVSAQEKLKVPSLNSESRRSKAICNTFKRATRLKANVPRLRCQRMETEENQEGKKGERSEQEPR